MNGAVSVPMMTFGATATYSCDAGYTLMGSTTSMCGSDMMWTPVAPTCDRTSVASVLTIYSNQNNNTSYSNDFHLYSC